MKMIMVIWMTALMLAGCGENPQGQKKALTCADNPEGKSLAERQQIADSCFLTKGSSKKSKPVEW